MKPRLHTDALRPLTQTSQADNIITLILNMYAVREQAVLHATSPMLKHSDEICVKP